MFKAPLCLFVTEEQCFPPVWLEHTAKQLSKRASWVWVETAGCLWGDTEPALIGVFSIVPHSIYWWPKRVTSSGLMSKGTATLWAMEGTQSVAMHNDYVTGRQDSMTFMSHTALWVELYCSMMCGILTRLSLYMISNPRNPPNGYHKLLLTNEETDSKGA